MREKRDSTRLWQWLGTTAALLGLAMAIGASMGACCEVFPDGSSNCACVEVDDKGHCTE